MAHPIVPVIESLIPRFCLPTFETKDAVAALGEMLEATDPRRIILRPRAGVSCDQIALIIQDWPLVANFFGEIECSWTKPQRIRLEDVKRAFGPMTVLPSFEEDVGPDTYNFEIRGQRLQGVVQIEATPDDKGETLWAESLVVRRFPPDPEPPSEGRAVRIVVFANFGAASSLHNVTPMSCHLWKESGLGELFGLLAPHVEFEVENHLGYLSRTLILAFSPDRIEDFTADGVIRGIPELAVFVDLREWLTDLEQRKKSAVEFRDSFDWNSLPATWKRHAEEVLRGGPLMPFALIRMVDAALSKQCESVLANQRLRDFQAVWLGLQFVASNMDFEDGSRVEVYTTPKQTLEEMFREGLYEEEHFHRVGPPPVLVILGESLDPQPDELDRLKRLSALASQIETPIAFGASPGTSPRGWADLASDASGRHLIACSPRVCLRPGISTPEFAPTCFEYVPSNRKLDTTVWGSSAWSFGALIGAAQATKADLPTVDLKAKLPPLIAAAESLTAPIFELPSVAELSRPGDSAHFTIIAGDAKGKFISLVNLRTLNETKAPAQRLATRFVFSPLVQTLRRINHRHATEIRPERIQELVREAMLARVPESHLQVEFRRDSGQGRLKVRLTPPFQFEGQSLQFSHEMAWLSK